MVEPSGVARGGGGKKADEECETKQGLDDASGKKGPRRTSPGAAERLELARALALLRFGQSEQDDSKEHSRAPSATRTSAAAIAIFDPAIAEKVAKACAEQATLGLHDARLGTLTFSECWFWSQPAAKASSTTRGGLDR